MSGKYCELELKPRELAAAETAVTPQEITSLVTYLELSPMLKNLCLHSEPPSCSALYNDLVEDVEQLEGKGQAIKKTQHAYCLSSISSTYRKSTQSTVSQANPSFRFTFSDKQDKRINLMEFPTESEYWIFCREFKRASSVTLSYAGPAKGMCIFTAKSGTAGTQNRWEIENVALKVIDSSNGLTYYSLIGDIQNPHFIFDYCLPKRNLDLDIKMDSDDEYFALKALITFENASLDTSNPIEALVSVGREKNITVPLYLMEHQGAPKMRVRVIENFDKVSSAPKDNSGIIQNFGETYVTFQDTSAPPLLIARNASREQLQFTDILIKPPQDSKRSLQILVHSASTKTQDSCLQIVSTKRTATFAPVPAALYCVIYALDASGKKLTSKDTSSSTSVYYVNAGNSSECPVWNEQFDLFSPDIVAKFDTIRIKIKIPNSGLLKDRNFGMVNIRPKDLFEDYPNRRKTVLMKEFEIPIEHCFNGISGSLDDKALGSLKLTIRINGMASADEKDSLTLPHLGSYASFGSLRVQYTFRCPDDLSTWWCCYDLHSVNTKAPRQSLSRRFSSFSDVKASTLLAFGNIHVGQGGVELRWCSKWSQSIEESDIPENHIFLYFDWAKLTSFDILSDSVVTLSIAVDSTTTKTLSLSSIDSTLDLLVAPCPAQTLMQLLSERITLSSLRYQVKDVLESFGNAPKSPRISASGSTPGSPLNQDSRGESSNALAKARVLLNEILFGPESSNLRSRLYAAVLIRSSHTLFVDLGGSFSDKTYLKSLIESDVTDVRNRLEMTQAEDAMRAVEEAERRNIDADVLRSVRVSAIIDAINLLCETAERRILDVFLSSEKLGPLISPTKFGLSSVSLIRDTSSSGYPIIPCLTTISNLYLSAIRELINDQLGTSERFTKVAGQQGKLTLLNFLIDNDKLFANMLEPYLSILSYEVQPIPVLLPGDKFNTQLVSYQQMRNSIGLALSPAEVKAYKEDLQKLSAMVCLNDFLDWYGEDVLLETQQWLARNLKQAWDKKENRYNLPWDIDPDDYRSTLPETLASQIKVYLDLCTEEVSSTQSQSLSDVQRLNRASSIVLKETRLLKIKSHITTASARCFLLLAEEFKRTLQMKHWSEGENAEECNQNGNFLIAIINDCYRTNSKHLGQLSKELMSEEDTSDMGALIKSATSAFNYVAEKAIAILVSVIFTDIEETLLSFDSLWGSDTFIKKMMEPLSGYFQDIKATMVDHYFQDMIAYSARSCVLRFLIFLRDRANKNLRFTEKEIAQLQYDISLLKCSFIKNCPLATDKINDTFSYLEEVENLISSDAYSQSSVQDQIRLYASRYQGTSRQIPRAVLDCCLTLRVTSGPYHQSVVDGILGKEGETGTMSGTPPQEKVCDLTASTFERDLFKKVFSSQSVALENVSHDARYLVESATKKSGGGIFGSWFGGKEKESKATMLHLRRQLDLAFGQVFDADEFKTPEKASDYKASDLEARKSNEEGDQIVIEISHLKVKGIVSSAMISQPNPYLVIQYMKDRKKTECAVGSEAEWNGVVLQFKVERAKLLQGSSEDTILQLFVFDKQVLQRKVPIGSVKVSLAGIHVHDIDNWFVLSGVKSNINSSVHLTISLVDPMKK